MRPGLILSLLLPLTWAGGEVEGECVTTNEVGDCKLSETTFVMIKPDGVQRGLVGELVGRLERKGLQVVAMQLMRPTRELVEQHYQEHKERPFFAKLVDYVSSGPVLAMVWQGRDLIKCFKN